MSTSDMQTAVRKATRLENRPPKTKHLLALKNMTLDDPASIDNILNLLEKRLKERSWIVTFKVLIILHFMMREGNCVRVVDAVMKQQGILDASKIKHKAQTQADIENIHMYKNYIEARTIAFRHTGRDYAANEAKFSYIRRNSAIGGDRLSQISIKEGLFKEMQALQKQMEAILQCKFMLDDSKKASEITCYAFRMVFDDLLTLFQSVNEGVNNILDHYFNMKKSDAQTALEIYKRFAHQTELTMDYLKHVRMIQNELQIRDVPSRLKHAPLSMTAALREYLSKATDAETEAQVMQNRKALKVSGEEASTQQVSGQPQQQLPELFPTSQQPIPSSAAVLQQEGLTAIVQQNTAVSNNANNELIAFATPTATVSTAPFNQFVQQQQNFAQYAQHPQQQFLMQKSNSEPQQQTISESVLDDAFSTANRTNPLKNSQILRQASMPNFHVNNTVDTMITPPLPSPTNYSSNPFTNMMTSLNSTGSYSAVGPVTTATTATTQSLTDSMSTINSLNSLMSVGSAVSNSGHSTPHHHHNPFRSFSLNTTANSSAAVTPLSNDFSKAATTNANPFFPASPPLTPNNPMNSTFVTHLQQQQQFKSPPSNGNNPFSQGQLQQSSAFLTTTTCNNNNFIGF